ncbi:unnamed protein product [Caenorhabditis sp. 36 PRJEB53466]|nr:unnamed protein product [Caenorhabditis sp. 36 PRJEB53466]
MPGSVDQEIHMTNEPPSIPNGLTEHRTHQYVNRPDGEMDMMIGFFLMNGFCVSFFLLFGLCVIFSCLRKRHSFSQQKHYSETDPILSVQEESLKPKLKSIVSQVIKSNKCTTKVSLEKRNDEMTSNTGDSQIINLSAPHISRSTSPSPYDRKTTMIRHNLLGPLSFDDLHYM